jgi:hypothetical protein
VKPRVYVETTIVSYLVARPTRDVVQLARQELTRQWWDERREDFELYVSPIVVREAGAGDPRAAERRLQRIRDLPRLEVTDEVIALANLLITEGPLPETSVDDAFHLALATVHDVDYLLTWNCAHLANAQMMAAVRHLLETEGYAPPEVCVPEELLEK